MSQCADCRFWSEMVAKAHGPMILAMCLAPGSRSHGIYTRSIDGCQHHKSNTLGTVDSNEGVSPYEEEYETD